MGDVSAPSRRTRACRPAERKYIHDGADELDHGEDAAVGAVSARGSSGRSRMGKLMTDPVWWFYLFWLPKFLAAEHGIRGVALIPYLTTVYIDRRHRLGGRRLPVVGADQDAAGR